MGEVEFQEKPMTSINLELALKEDEKVNEWVYLFSEGKMDFCSTISVRINYIRNPCILSCSIYEYAKVEISLMLPVSLSCILS